MAQDPALTQLMNLAGRYPVLPPAQQLSLARQVRTWLDWPTDAGPCPTHIEARGRRAKQRLIETNLRLVATIAHKHAANTNAELVDLVQEGSIGLARAVDLFDPSRGYQFSTYSYWWIRQTIGRAAKDDQLIRVPEGTLNTWSRLSRLVSEYELEHDGQRPSLDWLAAETGLSHATIQRCIVIGQVRVLSSLDARAKGTDSDASTIGELVCAQPSETADDADDAADRAALLQQLLSKLPAEDRRIIQDIDLRGLRHGDLTAELGVGRSRIGQLHARARQRLQAIADQHLAAAAA